MNIDEIQNELNISLNPNTTPKQVENTFIIPIVRHDMIQPMLESLYKFTDPDTFRVIVIDQSPQGVYEKIKQYTHIYLRPYRNLGFAKAMNTGIMLSDTPFVSLYNDDVEFLNDKWWSGIKETFKMVGQNCIGVNPMSPKEAAWGYGGKAPEGRILTEDGRGVVWLDEQGYKMDLEKCRTPEGYDWLLKKVHGWIDGIAMWGTTLRVDLLEKVGLLDEKFYPGGGEDYDFNARCYDPDWGGDRYRLVATSRSWVYHKWGSSGSPDTSKEAREQLEKQGIVFDDSYRWNNWTSFWDKPGHHPTVARGRVKKVHHTQL